MKGGGERGDGERPGEGMDGDEEVQWFDACAARGRGRIGHADGQEMGWRKCVAFLLLRSGREMAWDEGWIARGRLSADNGCQAVKTSQQTRLCVQHGSQRCTQEERSEGHTHPTP